MGAQVVHDGGHLVVTHHVAKRRHRTLSENNDVNRISVVAERRIVGKRRIRPCSNRPFAVWHMARLADAFVQAFTALFGEFETGAEGMVRRNVRCALRLPTSFAAIEREQGARRQSNEHPDRIAGQSRFLRLLRSRNDIFPLCFCNTQVQPFYGVQRGKDCALLPRRNVGRGVPPLQQDLGHRSGKDRFRNAPIFVLSVQQPAHPIANGTRCHATPKTCSRIRRGIADG